MLHIFTDNHYLEPENRRRVFPLLFDLLYRKGSVLDGIYKIVPAIPEADIVIVSVDINFFFRDKASLNWVNEFIDGAIRARKIVWVYTAGDYGITLSKDIYTFRLSGFDSKLSNKTFILPSFVNSPYNTPGISFFPIPKKEKPSIGFVGNANGSMKKYISEFILHGMYYFRRVVKKVPTDLQPFYPSSIKRYRFLKMLSDSNAIETDFIFRHKYRAGIKPDEDKAKTSKEFSENMIRNPYTFCLRGAGNFSVRFYETLAMGRIPVVVKTDFRLPLQDLIKWKNHCVLLEADNFVADFVRFHSGISPEDFEKMQISNYKLWREVLNREAYFSVVATIFENKMADKND